MRDYSKKKEHREIEKEIPVLVLGIIAIILGIILGSHRHLGVNSPDENAHLELPEADVIVGSVYD